VETGSLSRAARLNLVSQSAVSQQLRALERRYGRRLIERAPRIARGSVWSPRCRRPPPARSPPRRSAAEAREDAWRSIA